MSKTTNAHKISSNMAPAWWGRDSMDLSTLDIEDVVMSRGTKDARFKKMSGSMILFRKPIFFKLLEGSMIAPVDDNGKVCLRMDNEEFQFLSQLEEMMITKMIQPKVVQLGTDPEVKKSFVVSESTDMPYAKCKVQTLGYTRTTGIDVKGKENVDTLSLLQTQGTKGDFLLRIEGVYVTATNCGLLVKIDMFRLTSLPSLEDVESQKKQRESDSEDLRNKRVALFMGVDSEEVKSSKRSKK